MKKFAGLMLIAGTLLAGAFQVTAADGAPEAEKTSYGIGHRLLWYLPNIVMDTTDLVSLDLSFGGTFTANAWATRFGDLGWEHSRSLFVGKGFNRQLGGGQRSAEHVGLLLVDSDNIFVSKTFGWAERYSLESHGIAWPDFTQAAYRDRAVDFWSIGARCGFIFGVDVEFHPVEVADLLATIFLLDISGDNL